MTVNNKVDVIFKHKTKNVFINRSSFLSTSYCVVWTDSFARLTWPLWKLLLRTIVQTINFDVRFYCYSSKSKYIETITITKRIGGILSVIMVTFYEYGVFAALVNPTDMRELKKIWRFYDEVFNVCILQTNRH